MSIKKILSVAIITLLGVQICMAVPAIDVRSKTTGNTVLEFQYSSLMNYFRTNLYCGARFLFANESCKIIYNDKVVAEEKVNGVYPP